MEEPGAQCAQVPSLTVEERGHPNAISPAGAANRGEIRHGVGADSRCADRREAKGWRGIPRFAPQVSLSHARTHRA